MAAEAEAARDARAKVSHVIQTTAERLGTLVLKLGRVCTTSRLRVTCCVRLQFRFFFKEGEKRQEKKDITLKK